MVFEWSSKLYLFIFLSVVAAIKDKVTIQTENELKVIMNQNANPCEDFYKYACGNWETLHPIPDYMANYNLQQVMTERNYEIARELLSENIEEAKRKVNPSAEDKAKIFMASCLDIEAINKRGVQPMLTLVKTLGGWPVLDENWTDTNFDWIQLAINAKLLVNWNYLFHTVIYKDIFNNSGKMIPSFGGIGAIPSLHGFNDTVYKYRVFETLKKFGVNEAVARSTTIEILQYIKDLQSLSNKGFITKTIEELEEEIPEMQWTRFLSSVYNRNFSSSEIVGIYGIEYFKELPHVVKKKGPRATANYVVWSVIDKLLVAMGDEFLEIINNYNKISQGLEKPVPRWRACMDILFDTMNTAASALFIHLTLPQKSGAAILEMTEELKSSTYEFLVNRSWPGPDTKAKIFEKLNTFWADLRYENLLHNNSLVNTEFENVTVDYDRFFETYLKVKVLFIARDAQIYDTQVLPAIWLKSLVMAEAIHVREENKLTLHPGILQPPLYHHSFSKYLDYSGIGNVVAHEIFHSFDNTGANYNAQGQLESWWNETDLKEFEKRANCFVKQYTNYTLNGIPVNIGQYGNAENIADNLGLKFAYKAYETWLQENEESLENEVVEGLNLTSQQLFFVRTAQLYCTTLRPTATAHEMATNVHAPGPYRVIGMLVNSEEFAEQFNCPINSPMNPTKKCRIW